MPIQIIPANPSFNTLLAQAIGQGIGNLGEGLQQRYQNQASQSFLNRAFGQADQQPMQGVSGMQQDQQIGMPQPSARPPQITPQMIAAAASHPSEAVRRGAPALKAQYEAQQKESQKFEERSFKRNEKYLEKLGDEQRNMPKKTLALQQMRSALESGELSGARNALADFTGLDFLKTAPAQAVNSAIKEFMISDLASITGRPNQFIEKQLSQALVNPQFKQKANEAILEGLEGIQNLKEKEIQVANDLEQRFVSQGREVPRNFQKLVDDQIKAEAKQFESQYQERLKELFPPKAGPNEVRMIDPTTQQIYLVPKDQVNAFKKQGAQLAK